MASGEVTGKTAEQVRKRRAEFQDLPAAEWYDFEERFCLAKIPRQPEDYDGPDRYCFNRKLDPDTYICKYHGGAGDPSKLDKYANLKHSMRATRETIMDTLDRDGGTAEHDLYDWITESWPEAYDIDVSDDPVAEYEFHALALEIIRAERGEGYILGEGERGEKRVFSPTGEMYMDDVPHYLADMIQRQRKLIMKMEDNLGISRKKRLANETAQDATDVFKSFAEVGASLINDADTEYDPDRFGQNSEGG